jgi:hypothetical protein
MMTPLALALATQRQRRTIAAGRPRRSPRTGRSAPVAKIE